MRPIDADELMKIAKHPEAYDYVSSIDIAKAPTLDVVSKGVFEQVKWERDIALAQLEKLGISLGEDISKRTSIADNDEDDYDWRDELRFTEYE